MMVETDKQATQQPTRSDPALKRLDVFVGKWNSEGKTIATEDEPSINIKGTDLYEWFPDGFFLIHHVDVRMGEEPVKVLEVIGGDDASGQTYPIPMRSFDNGGNFQTMQASVSDEGVWTFRGETIRTTLVIADDGKTMTAKWEKTDDGSRWQHWMDMKFTKVKLDKQED